MSLEITPREREGIVIFDMRGRLTAEEASALREAVAELRSAGKNQGILNLEEVDYIDSTGLGTMVIGFTSLQKAGGNLKLLNLTRRSLELMLLTKLETVFEIFDDEQNAVNSFFPNRDIKRFDILKFIQQQRKQDQSG
jgi:anti-sigma B factor antagonist